jgi:hypothetical protein
MSNKSAILMAIYFPVGIILIGFLGYMYDKINKNNYFENKYKHDIFDMVRFIFFLNFTPIIFVHLSIKKRNKCFKNIVIVILFYIFLILAFVIGIKMIII